MNRYLLLALRWLGAISVSVFLWVSLQLSNRYRSDIEVPVRYERLPEQMKLTQPLPDRLRVDAYGKGFDLVMPAMNLFGDTAIVDLSPSVQRGYILSQKLRPEIARVLPNGVEIRSIDPDTLRLAIETKVSRRVPLVSNVELDPKGGWFFNSPVRLDPDSVTLTGAASEIDSIRFWLTDTMRLKGSQASGKVYVRVQPSPRFVVQPAAVEAEVQIDRFTEVSVRRRIVAENLPPNRQVRFIPPVIVLTVVAPLSHAASVQESDFTATVDYNSLSPDVEHVTPVIENKPAYVISVRSQPAYVRYVISEKELP